MIFRLILVLVFSLLVWLSVAQPVFPQVLKPRPVRGVKPFFDSAEGTIAYLPNAENESHARASINFWVLYESGKFTLRKKTSHWFIVNHKTEASSKPNYTYLGVLIIPVYPPTYLPEFGVNLHRNSDWARVKSTQNNPVDIVGPENVVDPKNVVDLDEVNETYEKKTIADFVNAHAQSELTEMDMQFYPHKWHGVPKFGKKSHGVPEFKKNHSWAKRARWKYDLIVDESKFCSSFVPPIPESANMVLKAYLLRFLPTHKPTSDNRLVFHFDGRNVVAAHIKLFSPRSADYDAQYFLRFR